MMLKSVFGQTLRCQTAKLGCGDDFIAATTATIFFWFDMLLNFKHTY